MGALAWAHAYGRVKAAAIANALIRLGFVGAARMKNRLFASWMLHAARATG